MKRLSAVLGKVISCALVAGCVADYDVGQTSPEALTIGTHTLVSVSYTEWPDMSGQRLTYLYPGAASRVGVFDLATGTETLMSGVGNVWYPKISGDRVIWLTRRCVEVPPLPCAYTEYAVRLYDIATGATTDVVTQTGGSPYPFDIDGDALVYQAADGIHLQDLAAGTDLVIVSGFATRRDLRIDDGYVVWFEDPDIFIYDIAAGTAGALPHSLVAVDSPDVSQGRVVFAGMMRNNWDLFLYDIALGTTDRLTRSGKEQILPRIAGDYVAYEESGTTDRGRVIDLSTGEDVVFANISSTGEWNSPQVSETHVAYMESGLVWAAELLP